MDILHLVDRLEELFNNSKPIPLSRSVVVDEDSFMDIIDQMRISIPDDIKKAQQIIAQKDRILAQAQEEANRTLALARERSEKMIEKSDIYVAAQAKADQIIDQARKEAAQTQLDTDRYVIETLTNLEGELNRILTQVRNGIKTLQASQELTPPVEDEELKRKPKVYSGASSAEGALFLFSFLLGGFICLLIGWSAKACAKT